MAIKLLNASGQPMAESFAGASRSSQELMFFDPDNADIDAAIDSEGAIINARAKDLVRNNADVSGGLDQSNATIVGSKYRFNCKANHRILGISEEQAKDWNFKVESITSAYLNSSSNYVDVQRKRNFVQMLSQINTSSFIYGESFFSREHKKNRTGIGTCFQILNPERIETPFNKKAVMGVVSDKYGAASGYYVRAPRKPHLFVEDKHKYVPKFGKFGQQIFHVFDPRFADQTRGFSKFAPIIKEAFMLDQFKDAELKSKTLVNQFMVYLTSEVGVDALKALDLDKFESIFTQSWKARKSFQDAANLKVNGNKVPALYNGDKLQMLNPDAKATDLGDFEKSILRSCAKSFSQGYAQYSGDYSSQNRASTDAAKSESWKQTKYIRSTLINKAADYMLWGLVDELVMTNQIKVPGDINYFKSREFLLNGNWVGEGKGVSNELANAQANDIYLATSQKTLEDILAESGGSDVADAIDQRHKEVELFKSKKMTLPRTHTNKNANESE